MRHLLLASLILVLACSDSNNPDGPVDIEGTWTWSAEFGNDEIDLTCTASGGATIEQSGSQFSGQIVNGTGTCTGAGGSGPFDPNGPIVNGTIDDDNVAFADAFCDYSGVATGDPVDEVDGDMDCVFIIEGESVETTGTWEMAR